MSSEELRRYVDVMQNHLMDLHQTRIRKHKLFERDNECLFYKINMLTAYLDFLENYFLLGNQDEYYNNIIEYCSLIEFSELINNILKTNYKPTFLLDVSNNQSIISGGY